MSHVHRQSSVVSRQFNRYLTKHRSLQQLYKLFMMLAFAVAFLTSGQVMAVTIISAAGGAWDAGTTWAGGAVPAAGDDVSIGHAITAPAAATLAAKTIVFSVGGSLTLSNTKTLTLGGNLGTNTAGDVAGSPNLTLTGDANHNFDLAGDLTVSALTLMTPTATRTISVTAFTIIASSLTGFATCSSAASPVVAAGALASPIASTSGGSGYSCAVPVVNNVSAPIFSTKEKAAVFSEEVK